jgi:hypothetical protein
MKSGKKSKSGKPKQLFTNENFARFRPNEPISISNERLNNKAMLSGATA